MRSKLDKEMLATMVGMKRRGFSNRDICRAVGINEATFYRWLVRDTSLHRALCKGIKKAEAEYKAELLELIMGAARKSERNWCAAAWLLERKYPDEYGRGCAGSGAGVAGEAAAPQVVLGVEVKKVE